jgi:hypothetical protein
MPKAAFSSVKSSTVTVPPSSRHVHNGNWKASSQNMHWHYIGPVVARLGSRTKCFTQSTFVVIGTDRDRKTGALRALLAHNDSAGRSYAGAAFIALAGDERTRFFAEVERLTTSWNLFRSSRMNDVRWCHPKLAVEVKHLAGSKMLRHATVKRLS